VALGATAVEGVLGTTGTMGSLRGKFLEYRGIPFMPTYHPSYLLRNQSNTEKRKVWEDLLLVMNRLEMPVTDKQRGFFLAK
jgi:DNA polymerase